MMKRGGSSEKGNLGLRGQKAENISVHDEDTFGVDFLMDGRRLHRDTSRGKGHFEVTLWRTRCQDDPGGSSGGEAAGGIGGGRGKAAASSSQGLRSWNAAASSSSQDSRLRNAAAASGDTTTASFSQDSRLRNGAEIGRAHV